MIFRLSAIAAGALLVSACSDASEVEQTAGFDAIAADETVYFLGNEPFWGGEVTGTSLRYSTPENSAGDTFEVSRFVGNSGLGLSGQLAGAAFDLTITIGECSDTMSDRAYPFTATLKIDEELRSGCAWTDEMPFTNDVEAATEGESAEQ